MLKPDPVPTTHVVKQSLSGGFSQDDDMPMVATERRRKSQPRLPVDDDEESDGAQADEEPLAGSRVRMGLVNIDTGTTRRQSTVVSSASRRFLIEDDETHRRSMLVRWTHLFVCFFMPFFPLSIL